MQYLIEKNKNDLLYPKDDYYDFQHNDEEKQDLY
jgi:hypothetical protein